MISKGSHTFNTNSASLFVIPFTPIFFKVAFTSANTCFISGGRPRMCASEQEQERVGEQGHTKCTYKRKSKKSNCKGQKLTRFEDKEEEIEEEKEEEERGGEEERRERE